MVISGTATRARGFGPDPSIFVKGGAALTQLVHRCADSVLKVQKKEEVIGID
jgi:hypothetical protein